MAAEVLADAETVEWLSTSGSPGDRRKRIVCTGEAIQDTVLEAFAGVQLTSFQPQHKVRLDNKYACFADFSFSQG